MHYGCWFYNKFSYMTSLHIGINEQAVMQDILYFAFMVKGMIQVNFISDTKLFAYFLFCSSFFQSTSQTKSCNNYLSHHLSAYYFIALFLFLLRIFFLMTFNSSSFLTLYISTAFSPDYKKHTIP